MMKFFRKHNKKLLAIFMALLMIVFIGGSALEGLLTPNVDSTVGMSRFGEIRDSDLQREKEQTTDILELSGRDWMRPFPVAKPLGLLEWYLLVNESTSLDLAPNEAEARASVAGAPMDQIAKLAQRLRRRPDSILRAIAEYRAVQNAALAMGAGAYPSEAEVQKAARDALEKAQIRAVVIPAEALVHLQPEPTDDEIQAQFAKYRDQEPGGGLDFGYYRQPAASVEYVKIDRDAIIATVGVPNLERRAKNYYEENKEKHLPFRRHPGNTQDPPAPVDGAPPAPTDSEFLTWDEAKPIALAAVKKQQAGKVALELANWIVEYTTESWSDAARNPNGYRTAPADVRGPEYFEEMLRRVPSTLNHPGAVTVATTGPFTLVEAPTVPPLGTNRMQTSAGMPFSLLVARTEAFMPTIPTDAGADGSDYLALYQTCRYPLHDAKTDDYYVFRVIEALPGRPAESVDRVREEVVADVKLRRAYEDAKGRAEALRGCADGGGIKEAYEGDHDLAQDVSASKTIGGYFEPQPFSRVPQALAAEGRSEDGVYVGAGVGKLPRDAIDQVFALAESERAREVIELPNRAAVVVIEAVGVTRAQEDEFNTLTKQLGEQLASARWRRALASWLDPEQIRARNGFRPAVR